MFAALLCTDICLKLISVMQQLLRLRAHTSTVPERNFDMEEVVNLLTFSVIFYGPVWAAGP